MKILFLSHYFPPEVNAPAVRTFEHCLEWVQAGHEVHVITCVPSHPRGVPFPGYRAAWYQREEMEGIHVHRVWTYLAANQGVVKRTLNYLSFAPSAVWRALRLGPVDVVIATSPQFFCAVTGYLVGVLKRTPWIFELRDLWPESIAAVGALKRSFLLRAIEKLELHLYRSARAVVCLTHAFMENLRRRGIEPGKLHYIPNGVNVSCWQGGDVSRIRRECGLEEGDCIVSYIGTVGMAHGIHSILECAGRLLTSHPEIHFFVIGDGAELDNIRQKVAAEGLRNVHLTGLVPRAAAQDFMAATDVSLVLLRRSYLFQTVLPSKLFEAMAAGKPVILGVEGEARKVLEASGGGVTIPPEDTAALTDAVVRLAREPGLREELGRAGQAFVAREFDRKTWAGKYLEVIRGMGKKNKR